MDNLKPCPFCGGKPYLDYALINSDKQRTIITYHKIKCARCKAQTGIFLLESDAEDAWNGRVQNG